MKVVGSIEELVVWCDRYRAAGLSVGFVPTMGALHQGHVSHLLAAKAECDRVVVSIFVNPTQFGPGEDLEKYPKTPESDLEACRRAGVDLAFFGTASDMYPRHFQTWVSADELSRPLCGRSRPGHFRGVATVVAQLLNLVKPHRAYFGLKDYQQLLVIRRLAMDLHFDTEIRACQTVREGDGLAMSSRNAYLDARARQVAPRIYRALLAARALAIGGEQRVAQIRKRLLEELQPGPELEVDYAEVLNAEDLSEFEGGVASGSPSGILIAVAARVGRARLIDNLVIPPS